MHFTAEPEERAVCVLRRCERARAVPEAADEAVGGAAQARGAARHERGRGAPQDWLGDAPQKRKARLSESSQLRPSPRCVSCP